ncbi:hypothetical protein MTO96_018194 [Rhipicephalus appendiculatus]
MDTALWYCCLLLGLATADGVQNVLQGAAKRVAECGRNPAYSFVRVEGQGKHSLMDLPSLLKAYDECVRLADGMRYRRGYVVMESSHNDAKYLLREPY